MVGDENDLVRVGGELYVSYLNPIPQTIRFCVVVVVVGDFVRRGFYVVKVEEDRYLPAYLRDFDIVVLTVFGLPIAETETLEVPIMGHIQVVSNVS